MGSLIMHRCCSFVEHNSMLTFLLARVGMAILTIAALLEVQVLGLNICRLS